MIYKSGSSQPDPSRTVISVIVVLLILGALAFFVVRLTHPQKSQLNKPATGLTPPSVGNIIKSPTLGGTVKAVGLDSVTISVIGVPAETGLKYDSSDRVAHITSDTKIVLTIERNGVAYVQQEKAYADAVKKADPKHMPNPPMPYTTTSASLSDIKVGDGISVTSVNGADISGSKSFDVSQISIIRQETN